MIFRPQYSWYAAKTVKSIPREICTLWLEPCFFGDVAVVRLVAPRLEMESFADTILLPLNRDLDFTTTPHESFLVAYDCSLAYPTLARTPLGVSLKVDGCSCFR